MDAVNKIKLWHPALDNQKNSTISVHIILKVAWWQDSARQLAFLDIGILEDTPKIDVAADIFKQNQLLKLSIVDKQNYVDQMAILLDHPANLIPKHVLHPYSPPSVRPSHYMKPVKHHIEVNLLFNINDKGKAVNIRPDSIYFSHLVEKASGILETVQFKPAIKDGLHIEELYRFTYQFEFNEKEWLDLPPFNDSIMILIRTKCVKNYLLYKKYYNTHSFPYKNLNKQFINFNEIIPKASGDVEDLTLKNTSTSGIWIWPYLSAYAKKRDDSKIFKNYSTFYVYDSIFQFHGVVAVNDTDHTNIKLLGGQFANIELMFNELSSTGIGNFDHFIGKFYPYSKRYKAGWRKIELSDITTSLELYAKILSRSFDPSFFGYEVYKPRYNYSSGAILDNYWVNYHRGKTNYHYYKNGEYELVVTTDLFVQPNRLKTRKLEEAKRQCVFVSTDYPYSSFEGYIPSEIKIRINPIKGTIKVKITNVKDINQVSECILNDYQNY